MRAEVILESSSGFFSNLFLFKFLQRRAVAELIYKQECYEIVGACMEVYNQMGCGFLEAVYQECLGLEWADREIPFDSQQILRLKFQGRKLRSIFVPDFVCF
jgi:hypothetical protein